MTRLSAAVTALVMLVTPAMACTNKGDDLQCLQCNIYHEARGEPVEGQLAVALVTLNRSASEKYPDKICNVVWQRKQFSWTSKRNLRMSEPGAREQARVVATTANMIHQAGLTNVFFQSKAPVEHFHAVGHSPSWAKRLTRVTRIGRHIFYRR